MTGATPDLKLDPKHTAIVVIDLQKGITSRMGAAAQPIVANAARLLTAARSAGAQPVLVHVGGSTDGADRLNPPTDTPPRAGTLPPDWMDLLPELSRQPGDVVVLKRQWGAF